MPEPGTSHYRRFVDTPVLRIGYEEWNRSGRHPIVLLHGWPDSPRCWLEVGASLSRIGYRVIAPALRGFAPTEFRDPRTPRSGQLAALGRDLIELIASLGLERPSLVGHDWGARAASIACGLRPGIASHLVMLSVGYGTNSPAQPLSWIQARNYWYHWYMATARGEQAVREQRRAFAQVMWDTWTPTHWYEEAEFNATAVAFDTPDWPEVVLHSYRHRWGFASGDARYADDERALASTPLLNVPTLVIHGALDACNHPDSSADKEQFFTGPYRRVLLDGIGHFPQREAPQSIVDHIVDWIGASNAAP